MLSYGREAEDVSIYRQCANWLHCEAAKLRRVHFSGKRRTDVQQPTCNIDLSSLMTNAFCTLPPFLNVFWFFRASLCEYREVSQALKSLERRGVFSRLPGLLLWDILMGAYKRGLAPQIFRDNRAKIAAAIYRSAPGPGPESAPRSAF